MRKIVKNTPNSINLLALLFLVIFVGLAYNSILTQTKWIYDAILAIGFLAITYFWRDTLKLNTLIFFILNGFILVHNLGAFFYFDSFYGLDYDIYVHFIYGVIFAVFIFHYLSSKYNLKKSELFILTILIVMGISSIHEVVEFTGAIAMGPGEGVLFFGAGDQGHNDAEWDLVNGFLGSFFAALSMSIISSKKST